jgi:hypothetical protein
MLGGWRRQRFRRALLGVVESRCVAMVLAGKAVAHTGVYILLSAFKP